MGQARNRGTREERVLQGIQKREAKAQAVHAARLAREKS
jgi:hypothetical protein